MEATVKTRFATFYKCFVSLLRCKPALTSVVSMADWPGTATGTKPEVAAKARTIAAHIGNGAFWPDVQDIVTVWEPIAEVRMSVLFMLMCLKCT